MFKDKSVIWIVRNSFLLKCLLSESPQDPRFFKHAVIPKILSAGFQCDGFELSDSASNQMSIDHRKVLYSPNIFTFKLPSLYSQEVQFAAHSTIGLNCVGQGDDNLHRGNFRHCPSQQKIKLELKEDYLRRADIRRQARMEMRMQMCQQSSVPFTIMQWIV